MNNELNKTNREPNEVASNFREDWYRETFDAKPPEYAGTETQPDPNLPTSPARRKFLKQVVVGGAGLATAAILGFGYGKIFGFPDLTKIFVSSSSSSSSPSSENQSQNQVYESNSFHIGEGEPRNGTLTLDTSREVIASVFNEHLGWFPDGRTPYATVKDNNGNNVRRYFFSGGPDNASYMVQTDGSKPLEQMLIDKQIKKSDFVEVLSPDTTKDYRKYYTGITSILQFDKSNQNHLLATYHAENRPTRDASKQFVATIGLAESFDGGFTWKDKGPFITGTNVATPGYKDSKGEYRVSGAGQPAAFYNPVDGYVHFAWVDWRADETKPDQIYGARAKANDNGTLGQLEYWTENGYSTNLDGNNLKSIVPVPQDQPEIIYTALPSMAWSTTLNKMVITGESDNGFWYATSTDFVNWTKPKIIYGFSQSIMVDDPDKILGPYDIATPKPGDSPTLTPAQTPIAGLPHSILQPGQLWESYPMLWDESMPSSDVLGENVVLLHSAGNNIVAHQPTFLRGTIATN